MAAPLVGTWRGRAKLKGKASVHSGGVSLFSWTPELLDFGLGVRDLRLTTNVDLDPAPAVPQLQSATVHVQALIYGTGAFAFNRPVDLEVSPRDGALELRGQLVNERFDLAGVSARLDADLVLTIRPSPEVIDVEVDASGESLVDEQIPTTRVTVATLRPDRRCANAVAVVGAIRRPSRRPTPWTLRCARSSGRFRADGAKAPYRRGLRSMRRRRRRQPSLRT
jgi:hypothetical protein